MSFWKNNSDKEKLKKKNIKEAQKKHEKDEDDKLLEWLLIEDELEEDEKK